MKVKNSRLETLKMLISSQELSSQDQVLQALAQEGYAITQATLSRDLKLLKVAKAASSSGKYTYVLPNDALYKRVPSHMPAREMALSSGFYSINFKMAAYPYITFVVRHPARTVTPVMTDIKRSKTGRKRI